MGIRSELGTSRGTCRYLGRTGYIRGWLGTSGGTVGIRGELGTSGETVDIGYPLSFQLLLKREWITKALIEYTGEGLDGAPSAQAVLNKGTMTPPLTPPLLDQIRDE